MDNDTAMLEQMGAALTTLQIKYRAASLPDRVALRPQLDQLLQDYTKYQSALLVEGVITKDEDLAEMAQIKEDIDAAVQKQQLLAAIARTAVFVAEKMA